jgi:hypothetical protein
MDSLRTTAKCWILQTKESEHLDYRSRPAIGLTSLDIWESSGLQDATAILLCACGVSGTVCRKGQCLDLWQLAGVLYGTGSHKLSSQHNSAPCNMDIWQVDDRNGVAVLQHPHMVE